MSLHTFSGFLQQPELKYQNSVIPAKLKKQNQLKKKETGTALQDFESNTEELFMI